MRSSGSCFLKCRGPVCVMTEQNGCWTSGVLNLNKSRGMTSQQVVRLVKRKTGIKKVGHAGTLDPLAEGVLPILLGKGTRLFQFLLQTRKEYRVTAFFGKATDTMDREGAVIFENEAGSLTEKDFMALLQDFKGDIFQEPPMYSAKHFQGKRLYKLAREGVTVERKKKKVTIFDVQLLHFDYPRADFRIECERGTYIRVICDEMGKKTGLGAHLHTLVRESLGPFTLERTILLTEFNETEGPGSVGSAFYSMNEAVSFLPSVTLDNDHLNRLSCGNKVPVNLSFSGQNGRDTEKNYIRIVSDTDELKAIGTVQDETDGLDTYEYEHPHIKPVCVF